MPQRQQILFAALTAFNQQGAAFTIKQLAARLSVPPSRLYLYFSSEPELIRQLVSFRLNGISQTTREPPHQSLAAELHYLLTTYQQALTPFSQTALLDLKLHYPEEWAKIIKTRESQWQKIAATLKTSIAAGRLRPIDTSLLQNMIDGMPHNPFLPEAAWCSNTMLPSLAELVDIFLFGIARRAP